MPFLNIAQFLKKKIKINVYLKIQIAMKINIFLYHGAISAK